MKQALALPLAIEATRLSVCLFLVSLLLPAPMLLVGCLGVSRLPEEVLTASKRKEKRNREKVASSDEPKTGLDRIAEMPSRSIEPSGTRRKISIEAWARAFPSLSKVGYKNSGDPKAAFHAGRNRRNGGMTDSERYPGQNIQMNRLSSDVWLETGHARRSSGKLDRIINMMAPRPQLSVMSSAVQEEDPNSTPKASKLNARAGLGMKMSPISFKAGAPYSDLPLAEPFSVRGPDIDVTTPTRFDRAAYRMSAATSPGAKSVKTAEVKLATRTRMSQTPVFLFGGSQGDMMMSARPSMEAVGLVEEGRAQNSGGHAERAFDVPQELESSMPGEPKELRRRTLELAKDLLGVDRRSEQYETASSMAVGVPSG